jgi:hypothetical protein
MPVTTIFYIDLNSSNRETFLNVTGNSTKVKVGPKSFHLNDLSWKRDIIPQQRKTGSQWRLRFAERNFLR